MPTIDEVVDFVREETRHKSPITADTNLQHDIGVFGDDMSEFLDAYAKRFNVDMSKCLWYFHTGEEGAFSIGGLFFAPPYRRAAEIPITVKMLHEFASSGEWSVAYPPHAIPGKRYDILVNQIVVALLLLTFLAIAASRLLR